MKKLRVKKIILIITIATCIGVFLLSENGQADEVSTSAREIIIDRPENIEEAIADAQPGDVLILPDGLYPDLRITFKANGEEGKPITLRGQTPGEVVITGEAQLIIQGRHLVVRDLVFDKAQWGARNIVTFKESEHCRLTECAFIECGNPEGSHGHIVILAYGSRHNRVDHCYMQKNIANGMTVRVAEGDFENTDNTFDHNYYKDTFRQWPNGGEVIQIGQGSFGVEKSMRALVEYCLFDNTNRDGEIISNKSSHNTYRYNTFRNCDLAELVLRAGDYATVEGNFFFDGMGGIRVHGSNHHIVRNYIENVTMGLKMYRGSENYQNVHHCIIEKNLIINCTSRGMYLGSCKEPKSATLPPYENRFLDNVIVGNKKLLVEEISGENNTWQDNIVWPTGSAQQGLHTDGLILRDPNLVYTNGVYRLPDNSSGPQEWPLEPKDVGPTWMNSPSLLYGDVSGDGEISAYDAALAAHIAVDLEHPGIKNPAAAEVSGDAEVTAYDAALIAQKAVGLIDKFPVEG